jgi:hypothetical protein
VLVVAAVAAGCGVPTGDSSFEEIPSEQIQFGLDATSTSTTSTTTTTTTLPEAPATTALATTSTIRLEPVEVYFVTRGRLQPVVFELPPGSSPDQIAEVLAAGPPSGVALDTLIEDGLILSAVEAGGILTVDLDEETFDRIPATEQTEAIGQIVLTMISSLRRVGQVTFTLAGEPIAVKKGNSLSSSVGEELAYEDYAVLLVTPPPPAENDGPDSATTTTSEAPATTSGPDSDASSDDG